MFNYEFNVFYDVFVVIIKYLEYGFPCSYGVWYLEVTKGGLASSHTFLAGMESRRTYSYVAIML